ncbi:MAG: ATP-grasp domain-containing protein [Candidatus Thorarchaeota archaeon]|nr:MAG: ATP-grasp domain-containing protein [Candidatus Thorarchaeota archaeon]
MRVFVYEHITAGGLAEERWDLSFAAQGFAMLSSLARSLNHAGHEIIVAFDSRINEMLIPKSARRERVSSSSDWSEVVDSLSEDADSAIVIAPEDEGILTDVLAKIRADGLDVVGPETETSAICSDKVRCTELYSDLSLPVPTTVSANLDRILDKSSEIDYPAVLKPAVSSGAIHTSRVSNEAELESLVDHLKGSLRSPRFVLQEFVEGVDSSVSLLVNDGQTYVLSVNRQNVSLGRAGSISGYHGGECHFVHPASEEAVSSAQKIVESLPGLRGYVGIDFVLQGEEAVPMDINPRVTVSAVGIERTRGPDALACILDCSEGQLLELPPSNGVSIFEEYLDLPASADPSRLEGDYARVMVIPGVVSPPILLPGGRGKVRPYVCGWGESREDARVDLAGVERQIDHRLGVVGP